MTAAFGSYFFALGVGPAFYKLLAQVVERLSEEVSIPSVSGGRLQCSRPAGSSSASGRFYALGVGRAFTVGYYTDSPSILVGFLCPRCRAGVYSGVPVGRRGRDDRVSMPSVSGGCISGAWCNASITGSGFYALGVGRAFTGPCRRGMSGSRTRRFYALGLGRAFTACPHSPRRRTPDAPVSMPSVSGGRLQGSPYLCHLSWADGSTCERLADGRLPETGFGRVKVRKRPLTCVRALPGFGGTTTALAAT
jgi:hypothetical protein